MRILGYVIVGCLALTVTKLFLKLLALFSISLLIWFGITRPRETFTVFFAFILIILGARYPLAGGIIIGAPLMAGLLSKRSA